MRTDRALIWGEIHQTYVKLKQCPGFVTKHLDLKDQHVFDEGFDVYVFWENLILLAAEGLSDKE